MKEKAVTVSQAKKLTPEEMADKYMIGVMQNIERPGYLKNYQHIIDRFNPPEKAGNKDKAEKENGEKSEKS
jgi:hypothetical protein